MTFTIHRGASEIGGSCVEICSAAARIVIDIGMPLMNPDGSPFDSANAEKLSVDDLRKEKTLPDIPALYGSVEGKETALLISHAHQDHYGLISFVDKKIPVYVGKAAHKLIKLTAVFTCKEMTIENPCYFESGKPFTCGDIEITPYLMDHSAFDAYAFLVRFGGKSLLYTGDFRAHGRKSKLFYKLLHDAPKNVDWLLMEGTTLSRGKQRSKTEEQLEKQFVETFKDTRGLNMVYTSGQNIDRLVTIFRSCRRCGKLFVIDFYIATILSELAALGYKLPRPSRNFPEIKVFFPMRLRKKMENLGRKDLIERFSEYEITTEEINDKTDSVVMTIRPSMNCDIERIQNLTGAAVIYSMWEGYKKYPETKEFFKNLEERGAVIKSIHTSGHADHDILQKLISSVSPREVVPIHTTEGGKYKEYFPVSNIRSVNNGEKAE
ncbi:MAG: MBL fold metallo-hydrolase [Treponema sp.]|nr:MBL fold metallo-hydrolase [Treponema sp.]